MAGEIHIGCSGWVYPAWRGVLYPPGLAQTHWLARYAEAFDTVEVNSTFYRLASPPAVERWVEATPPHFRFTVKASRYLTHITHLQKFESGVRRFYDSIDPLVESEKLEAVLWQLPPTQQRNDEMLDGALEKLPPGRHAFEFRHPSWFADDVLERLRAYDVALVIGDHPQRPWQPIVLTADFSLVRLHYGARGRRGNYSERELVEWAARIRELAEQADVLVYFNNDWEGFAVLNAERMQTLLARKAARLTTDPGSDGARAFLPDRRDLGSLERAAASCRGCDLWKTATQVVFGEGPSDARLMLVGEQPGDHEDIEGTPFVGPAGRVLDEALETAGIDRDRAYLTNAVKHFRFELRGRRRLHKTPPRWQVAACGPWLAAELEVVAPDVVVLMGAVAAHALLGDAFSVTRQHGRVPGDPTGRATVATVHPSSILRVPAKLRAQQMASFVDDLKIAAALLKP